VTESRDTGVETEAVREDFLDVVGRDRVQLAVVSSLGDDDDRLSLSLFTMLETSDRVSARNAMEQEAPNGLTRESTLHIEACQSSAVGGRSGMNM
jgi:hypothetical protein